MADPQLEGRRRRAATEADQGSIASAPSSDPAGGAPARVAGVSAITEQLIRERILELKEAEEGRERARQETVVVARDLNDALDRAQGTIRECIDCGCLIAGGPTRCIPCVWRMDGKHPDQLLIEIKRLRTEPTALDEAADEIARICGCPTWDYPGQLIRDVRALADERDALRLERDLAVRAQKDDRDALLRPTPDSVWPPSEVAHEVAERLHHAGDYDGAAVAAAYAHLLAHPVGTEAVIRTLRALRKLQRGDR